MGSNERVKARCRCAHCNERKVYADFDSERKALNAKYYCQECWDRLEFPQVLVGFESEGDFIGKACPDDPGLIYFKDGYVAKFNLAKLEKGFERFLERFEDTPLPQTNNLILLLLHNLVVEKKFFADAKSQQPKAFCAKIQCQLLKPIKNQEQFMICLNYYDGDRETIATNDLVYFLLGLTEGTYSVCKANFAKTPLTQILLNARLIFKNADNTPYLAMLQDKTENKQVVLIVDLEGKIREKISLANGMLNFQNFRFMHDKNANLFPDLQRYSDFVWSSQVLTFYLNKYFPPIVDNYTIGDSMAAYLYSHFHRPVQKFITPTEGEITFLHSLLTSKPELKFLFKSTAKTWLDPFAGKKNLLQLFSNFPKLSTATFLSNDLNSKLETDFHFDGLQDRNYKDLISNGSLPHDTCIITSPPMEIVDLAIGILVDVFDVVIIHFQGKWEGDHRESFLNVLKKTRQVQIHKPKLKASMASTGFMIVTQLSE